MPDTAVQISSARPYVPPSPARRPRDRPSRHSHRRARCHGIAPKHYQRGHGASVGFAVDPINAIANGPVDEEGDT